MHTATSDFVSHRLRSLLDGGFPFGLVGRRRFAGAAGEQDQVVFGLRDLREAKESEREAAPDVSVCALFTTAGKDWVGVGDEA